MSRRRLAPTRAVSLILVIAGSLVCRPRPAVQASRRAEASDPRPPGQCPTHTRLVDQRRASAMWLIQTPGTAGGAQPARFTGQYYSSGNAHIVILDTLGAGGCWSTADSVAAPVASTTEFLTNLCGPTPDSPDRTWVAVVRDTTADVDLRPRLAWRIGLAPPWILPAPADSVVCWRKFSG